MPESAQINRSLSAIRTELEFLLASNVLSQPQMQSILAQLPVFAFFSYHFFCYATKLLGTMAVCGLCKVLHVNVPLSLQFASTKWPVSN